MVEYFWEKKLFFSIKKYINCKITSLLSLEYISGFPKPSTTHIYLSIYLSINLSVKMARWNQRQSIKVIILFYLFEAWSWCHIKNHYVSRFQYLRVFIEHKFQFIYEIILIRFSDLYSWRIVKKGNTWNFLSPKVHKCSSIAYCWYCSCLICCL